MAGGSVIGDGGEIRRVVAEAVEDAERSGSARAVFRASAELARNLTVEARAGGFRLVIDEPESFAGSGLGPNPLETILASVGACLAVTAAVCAAELGVSIRRFAVDLRADVDLAGFFGTSDELPKGFERVVCETTLETDADEQTAQELLRLAEARCPGLGAMRLPVPVETRWQISREG